MAKAREASDRHATLARRKRNNVSNAAPAGIPRPMTNISNADSALDVRRPGARLFEAHGQSLVRRAYARPAEA
jgi:hypothetical protein